MSDTKVRIADKVRGVAAEHRFTQQEVAEILGVSRAAVVDRYNGRVAFTAPDIFALAVATQQPITRFYPELEFRAEIAKAAS